MNNELSNFAARLRGLIQQSAIGDRQFSGLALELFALQFKYNSAYRKICRGLTPNGVAHWTQIPFGPAAAFKELELSAIPPEERTTVFHSSGTTEQKPGRHFHNAESLKVYEASLWPWFVENVLPDLQPGKPATGPRPSPIFLTPPPSQAPHSSLVHMFETVRQKLGAPESAFVGGVGADGAWDLNFNAALAALDGGAKNKNRKPRMILGAAFSFVHLLDFFAEKNSRLRLPENSRVMETGGYKNRSRTLPKAGLHALIADRLGVPPEKIICEYGMSELSSQAYHAEIQNSKFKIQNSGSGFRFPPWARAQVVSPETGREVGDGETGLIRVLDLANVFSIAAIQTEDLAIRRGAGFEVIGRAPLAEPRGCSLMSVETLTC